MPPFDLNQATFQNLGVKAPEEFREMISGNRMETSTPQMVGKMDFAQFGKMSSIMGIPAINRIRALAIPEKGFFNELQSSRARKPASNDKGFPREEFTNKIVGIENEALVATGGNLYSSIGERGDLGKYQVNPRTLKDWSKPWLGKEVSSEEFLDSPHLQEEFWQNFLDVADAHGLTPEEAAIAWHTGWGELGQGSKEERRKLFKEKLKERMISPQGVNYLGKFRRT